MNRNAWIWILFALCCVTWMAVPASMILRYERTLGEGRVYLFRCTPSGPGSPFRGRYVALNFDQSRFDGPVPEELVPGATAYARLDRDDGGFAVIASVEAVPPDGSDYLKVRVQSRSDASTQLELPFDRFYMKETLAPEAESVYRERSPGKQAWVSVRLRGGDAVLEELYLDGEPIRKLLGR